MTRKAYFISVYGFLQCTSQYIRYVLDTYCMYVRNIFYVTTVKNLDFLTETPQDNKEITKEIINKHLRLLCVQSMQYLLYVKKLKGCVVWYQ
jgi:hypothetical protein